MVGSYVIYPLNTAAVVIGEDVMINCIVTVIFDVNAVIHVREDGVTDEGVISGFTDVDAVPAVPVRRDGVTNEGVVAVAGIRNVEAVLGRGDGVTDDGVVAIAAITDKDADTPAHEDGVIDDGVVAGVE